MPTNTSSYQHLMPNKMAICHKHNMTIQTKNIQLKQVYSLELSYMSYRDNDNSLPLISIIPAL